MEISFIQRLTRAVSIDNIISSGMPIDSIAVSIVAIIPLTSIAALPVIYPAALLTTDCPMSNTAITMLNVLLTKYTATHIFTKYLKNIQVSTSCRLFRSVIILISS